MTENRWTKPNRLSKVVDVQIWNGTFGEGLGPSAESFNENLPEEQRVSDGDGYWVVTARLQTGLDTTSTSSMFYTSREAAEAGRAAWLAEAQAADNTEESLPHTELLTDDMRANLERFNIPSRFKDLGAEAVSLLMSAGDDDYWPMVYESLKNAGVIDERYNICEHVIEWLGEESVIWMRETFGENWTAAAEFEYCVHHFPKSSLAYLAAQVSFFEFCTDDKYTVGYFVRMLEAIYHGTESLAQAAANTRKKAGEGGKKSSSGKRLKNLSRLIEEIEALEDLVGRVSEQVIFDQAYANADAKLPMPKSKKTKEDYGTFIRSEEPFKSRYFKVFRKNA
ncbi:hypothetical protein [Aliiruegeria lutimaris]|nr:hypothetical protein [Aliiruegeria lutimaris]